VWRPSARPRKYFEEKGKDQEVKEHQREKKIKYY
jgi:hypothetical protein